MTGVERRRAVSHVADSRPLSATESAETPVPGVPGRAGASEGRSGPRELFISVMGVPGPQGSKSFKGMRGGKPVLAESSKKVRPWREAVVIAARSAIVAAGGTPLDGPIEMDVLFLLPPPKTMPKGRTAPTVYPDLSKLVRSTEDALVTAGVIADDARIVRTSSEKRYADGMPGALIWIRPALLSGVRP